MSFNCREMRDDVEAHFREMIPKDRWSDLIENSERLEFEIWKSPENLWNARRGDEILAEESYRDSFFNYFTSRVRLSIAEHARQLVFIHAGAVSVNGVGVIFPGSSFQGKSTMVRELASRGALYFSDEYAIVDEKGSLHPFPKTISIRDDPENPRVQRDVPLERLGLKAATSPVPVGLIVITRFEPDGVWNPIALTSGMGILEMLPHTIPATRDPEFSLRVLNNVANRAIILSTVRGDAGTTASKLIEFIELQILGGEN